MSTRAKADKAVKRVAHDTPVECTTAAAWDDWLKHHHDSAACVWIRMAKKDSGIASVTRAEALEIALCHGWIDGLIKADGDDHFLQRFTPRTARSTWSKINRDKALTLIDECRMQPAGMAEVERARADGRWDAAYDAQSAAIVPPDLETALDANRKAKAFFAKLDAHNRYAVLFRIQGAKRPQTRALRIARFVDMLAKGEKIYP